MPQIVDPRAAVALVREPGRRVVTFSGFSGTGYEDEAAMLDAARAILARFDPRDTIVNAGATAEGIGAVYALARQLGFTTTGIVSSRALEGHTPIAAAVDRIAYVADDTWGGLAAGTNRLSPVSQAMVDASDLMVAIGGGEIARDELIAARRAGKPVEFIAADMNHATARERAARKGEPAPESFRGAVHDEFSEL